MSDLREALEKLATEWRYKDEDLKPWQEGGGPDPHESALDFASHQIAGLLAAHPAPARVEITDEMVEAVARAYYEGLGWDWDDLGGWDEDQRREREHAESKAVILREFRTALAAAVPFLQPQPVDRGRLIQVIEDTTRDHLWDKVPGSEEGSFEFEPVAPKVADAVLALLGGVDESEAGS